MVKISRTALKQLLADETQHLQKAIETQEEMARPGAHQVGDDGDQALNHVDRGKHQAVVEHLRQLLSQVQAARERLAAGTYGICMDCQRAIPEERLEALPYATLCVNCQSERDRTRAGRPGLALFAQR